jgi:DNA topoisomerase III
VAGIGEDRRAPGEAGAGEEEAQPLPPLVRGQRLGGRFRIEALQTRPPPRYSEATLLAAMESAGRQLDSEELRQQMRDVALGTPATRASIIETLLDRGYVERRGRQLHPTALGIDLIERLPMPSLASPELTGEWEARLARIARGEVAPEAFMADIVRYVQELVATVQAAPGQPRRSGRGTRRTRAALGGPPKERGAAGTRRLRATAMVVASAERAEARGGTRKKRTDAAAAPRKKRTDAHPVPSLAATALVNAAVGAVLAPPLRCPRCQTGHLLVGRRGWGCSCFREGCPLVIPFEVLGCRLREADLRQIVESGASGALEFCPIAGPPLRGRLRLAAAGSPAGFVYLDPL